MTTSPSRALGSTYRLQLNGVGFAGAAATVPFLADLGVETLYVSPITRARSGSSHGYDVVDPTQVDPALGGADGLAALLQTLDEHGMRLLVDIVPNHMAATVENPLFTDVLRYGRRSQYASFFDVAWETADNTIVLPMLDAALADVLDANEIRLRRTSAAEYVLTYRDNELPLDPTGNEDIVAELAASRGDLDAAGRRQLELVLAGQHYRLVNWRDAARLVNYRRFFDINDLIGVRQEDARVFAATHTLVFELARDPRVAGFRVDHIDGLRDPAAYLSSLRAGLNAAAEGWAGQPVIVVEKILERSEQLPPWPVSGTTGYEFAAAVTGLFVHEAGASRIAAETATVTGDSRTFGERAVDNKHLVAGQLFIGSLGVVTRRLNRAIEPPRPSLADTSVAVEELTTNVTVYRTYRRPGDQLSKADRHHLAAAAAAAAPALTPPEQAALDRVLDVLRGPVNPGSAAWEAIASWQQLTAPIVAKGVEDTSLYAAGAALVGVDVGTDPDRPAVSPAELHEFFDRRAQSWPGSLSAASTHDSKRSQDVRSRLAVLTEIAPQWLAAVEELEHLVSPGAAADGATDVLPDAADRRYAYETIVGAWPAAGEPDAEFTRRVQEHLVKASREAKRHSSWLAPDASYEEALGSFAERLLDDDATRKVLSAVVSEVMRAGVSNALAATVLRVAAPGVPDVYQGDDLWQLALVDPDNRRPLELERHRTAMAALATARVGDLLDAWHDGRVKQAVLRTGLQARRDHPDLFATGDYLALEATGEAAQHVVGFVRRRGSEVAVAVVPRLAHSVAGPDRFPVGGAWGDTRIAIPGDCAGTYTDVLTGASVDLVTGAPVAELLAALPVALLLRA
ncbi:MAG TPA: malto-oligosyltrehalose synthase [Mycobacteriales bacterium]|nr:malto-oligosyltrehalose synthase [Mycobacteriales bacterium]HWA68006.1 malto-oligosyltrehalose synthase [Mycobacteriales bacterium]